MKVRLAFAAAVIAVAAAAPGCGATTAPRVGPAPALEATLRLDRTTAVAGTPIAGTAVFTNRTRHSITIQACSPNPAAFFQVGLASALIPYDPAWDLPRCPPTVHLPPGTTTLTFTIQTRYQACTQPGGQPSPTSPPCLAAAITTPMPPLPPGRYSTKVDTIGLPTGLLTADPVTVTLTPAPPTTTSTTPTPSQSGLCTDPGQVATLTLTRHDPMPQNHITYGIGPDVTATNPARVAAVAEAACQLPATPPGARSCPADFGTTYTLAFRSHDRPVATVVATPTGCPQLRGLGPPRDATPTFWGRLAAAFNLPAPRLYCDPFRGRLPDAPTSCGPVLS